MPTLLDISSYDSPNTFMWDEVVSDAVIQWAAEPVKKITECVDQALDQAIRLDYECDHGLEDRR